MSASLLTEAAAALDPSDPYARREQTFPDPDARPDGARVGVRRRGGRCPGAPCSSRAGSASVDFFIVHAGAIEVVE